MKSVQNTRKIEQLVQAAAKVAFPHKRGKPVYEYGQWWYYLANGAQYSVVDAEPSIASTGLDFEQVKERCKG